MAAPHDHEKVQLSKQELGDVLDTLRIPLNDRKVLVPFGSQAFFAGRLAPNRVNGEELVLFHTHEGLQEMTRNQARQRLEAEIHSLQPLKTKSVPATKSKQPTGTEMPSYVEIREAIDERGNEIASEAMDVSKQLQLLQKDVGEANGTQYHATDQQGDDATQPWEGNQPSQIPSDEEYGVLAQRLEELARLEEEADLAKTNNKKSSLRLQSKGWSVGFLNKASKTKPNSTAPSPNQTQEQPISNNERPRKVAFDGNDRVKEIPLVGRTSVKDIRRPTTRPMMEESVFSGVVHERPRKSQQQQQQQQQQSETMKPTKLSRFAQERRHLLG